MEVESCGSTTVTGERHRVYSFADLKCAPEGVYRCITDQACPLHRFIVVYRRAGTVVITFRPDNKTLHPTNDGWRDDLFVRTDEKVCFEIR